MVSLDSLLSFSSMPDPIHQSIFFILLCSSALHHLPAFFLGVSYLPAFGPGLLSKDTGVLLLLGSLLCHSLAWKLLCGAPSAHFPSGSGLCLALSSQRSLPCCPKTASTPSWVLYLCLVLFEFSAPVARASPCAPV